MSSMSTPIQDLSGKPANPHAEPPQDPEVLSVLNEMEQEVAAAARNHHVPAHNPAHVPVHATSNHIPSAVLKAPVHHAPAAVPKIKSWYQPELLQKVGILAAIALVIFYPATLRYVYDKFPAYDAIFQSYDTVLRTVVFAIVLYGILWKFNM